MKRYVFPAAMFQALSLLCGVSAAELPELQMPDTVGVNIHFNRGHEKDLDLMKAAGIRVVRMDLGWAGIERKRGEYDWSAVDELTSNLIQRGIRPYYILDYSNPLYEQEVSTRNPVTGDEQRDTASPQHPESIAAFAKWAAAAAVRYSGKGIVWEIWNEPNISFWKPKPNVQQYIALASAVSASIRAADPGAIIVGPATSEAPMQFLEEFFRSGILESLDAVSIHPYRNYRKGPETAGEDYAKVRELITRFATEGKKRMPILSGEWGYASHTKGVSEEVQARFLVRQQLYNLFSGIPVSIWYDWKNDGTNPAEREENFGIVRNDLEPKLAYKALQTLTRELAGHRLRQRIQTEKSDDYALLFANSASEVKLAIWTVADEHEVELATAKLTPGKLQIRSLTGEKSETESSSGTLRLTIGPGAKYVHLGTLVSP